MSTVNVPVATGTTQDREGDVVVLRRRVLAHILQWITERKPRMVRDSPHKMPEYVRWLEEKLFRAARSLEEYGNLATVERLLQQLVPTPKPRGPVQNGVQQGIVQHHVPLARVANPYGANEGSAHGQVGAYMPNNVAFGPVPTHSHGMMGVPNANVGFSPGGGGHTGPPVQALGPGGLDGNARPGYDFNGPSFQNDGAVGVLSTPTGLGNGVQVDGLGMGYGRSPLMSNGAPIVRTRFRHDWSLPETPTMIPTDMLAHKAHNRATQIAEEARMAGLSLAPAQRVPAVTSGAGLGVGVGPSLPSQFPTQGAQYRRIMSEELLNPVMRPTSDSAHAAQGFSRSPGHQHVGSGGGMEGRISTLQVPTSITIPPNRNQIAGTAMASSPVVAPPNLTSQTNPLTGGGPPLSPGNASSVAPAGSVAAPLPPGLRSRQNMRERDHILVWVRHCGSCNAKEQCQYGKKCAHFKKQLRHVMQCKSSNCGWPMCSTLKPMLIHHLQCVDPNCTMCKPIKNFANWDRKERSRQQEFRRQAQGQFGNSLGGWGRQQVNGVRPAVRMGLPNSVGMQPSDNGLLQNDVALQQTANQGGLVPMQDAMLQQGGVGAGGLGVGFNQGQGVMGRSPVLRSREKRSLDTGLGTLGPSPVRDASNNGITPELQGMVPVAEIQPQLIGERLAKRRKRSLTQSEGLVRDNSTARSLGTSLLETFSGEEIEEHVRSLRGGDWVGRPDPSRREEVCCICALGDLNFEPAVILCENCFTPVRRGGVFWEYPQKKEGSRYLFCHACVGRESKDETFTLGRISVVRSSLIKRKNDELEAEAWVQCDGCGYWAHQICSLFNKGQNTTDMGYLCPSCLVDDLRSGKRKVLSNRPRTMWGANKLPECHLSRGLEYRLKEKLQWERAMRANKEGRAAKDVATVEGLTVRVLNNVLKKTEVQPNFLKVFKEKGFPTHFPYRQKVILLFQKIDGVDVCLFAMYTQEYGDDCPEPNRKWVYLSYVDSVKYFRPEIVAFTGDALRTFVYHELLLGYLTYVKKVGHSSVFIWACPPSQSSDDYILYCKPTKQKTPTPERLRSWYLDLLQKGKQEGVVKYVSNLADSFFENGKDHNYEAFSATAIPYFEGDYWPGEAEKLLANLAEENRENWGKKSGRGVGKRKGRNRNASADDALQSSILKGQPSPQWEDFMVVHLRDPCNFCRKHINGGFKYYYTATKLPGNKSEARERQFEGIKLDCQGSYSGPLEHFQLCEDCYQRASEAGDSSLPGYIKVQDLIQEAVEQIPPISDQDADYPCEILESRQSFLSFCKGNHYQFDTLRRAKHSTMMVLYHLHNPMAPAFASTCNVCNREMEPGQGYRCQVCPDFDMCVNCQRAGQVHQHPLAPQSKPYQDQSSTPGANNGKMNLAKKFNCWVAALTHAVTCTERVCRLPCQKMKQMIAHVQRCQESSRCRRCLSYRQLCEKHSRQCVLENCPVFGCRAIKEELRRSRQTEHGKRVRQYMKNYNRTQVAVTQGPVV